MPEIQGSHIRQIDRGPDARTGQMPGEIKRFPARFGRQKENTRCFEGSLFILEWF